MDDSEDYSWLDETVRRSAVEMLQVLFASTRVCVVTFDGAGVIVGVNPQTAHFGGRPEPTYQGVSLVEHPVLRRLGLAPELRKVLAGETIEITDSRWVTLFSGEERFVDVVAGPVEVDERVVGGVAYLIDVTAKHRAFEAQASKRKRARELEEYLAGDVAALVRPLETWAETRQPSPDEEISARETARDLALAFDDLVQFIQLEAYKPNVERLPLADALRPFANGTAATAEGLAAFADQRLLKRVLRNMSLFRLRVGGGKWTLERTDGRVRIHCTVDASNALVREMLTPNSLSTTASDGADHSLAAARWMAELMGGSLTVAGDPPRLTLELPAADAVLAAAAQA